MDSSLRSSLGGQDKLKADYKEFTKMYLKVKFEQLYNKHEGQNIPQNAIWKEALRLNKKKEEWADFILTELKNVEKYSRFTGKKTFKRT